MTTILLHTDGYTILNCENQKKLNMLNAYIVNTDDQYISN